MNKTSWNKIFPYLAAILLFALISIIYFYPALEGKRIQAHDNATYKGGAKELADYREKTGEEAIWTNSMFGGMPGYLTSVKYQGNIVDNVKSFIYAIPRPISYMILNLSIFFLLGILLGANIWISFAGAIAYGLTTFFFVITQAGHYSKAHTLAFMALVVGGVLFAYRKNRIGGSLLAAFGLSWMLSAGHPQVTYYAGILILIVGLTYFIYAIKENALASFIKTSAMLIVAALLAVGTNFSKLYTTYEYGKYSTRSKSELTDQESNKTSGLDRDYILSYSYDIGEALTAFIPRFKGGGMSEPLGEKSEVYDYLSKVQGKGQARKFAQNLPLYWGSQPIVSGPFYYGAVLCFLFVLGLFIVRGKDKWWIAAVVLISFLLSMGKYFPALSNFMIDYFPGYNKFRDVKNIIVIQQFAMALLGVLAIKVAFAREISDKQFLKALKYSFAITGGLALLFVLIPSLAGDFTSSSDARYAQAGWPQELIDALRQDRKYVLKTDAFRTFIFVSLAAATLWAFWKKKIKSSHAIAIWCILTVADMWPVDKRYLNNDNFVPKRKVEVPYKETPADKSVLADNDPDFRVLNISVDPFNDASTSYYHKSIGGYHGAKMKRYQELIEHHISREINGVVQRLHNVKSSAGIDSVFMDCPVLNMLNTKYLIYNPNANALYNRRALGSVWLTENFRLVDNADQEIAALSSFNPAKEAIIDKRFAGFVEGLSLSHNSGSTISLIKYSPNHLVYEYKGTGNNLAVFSEIYYPKGWNAYINGKPAPYLRADYVLRAMVLKEGEYNIEFKFEPNSYKTGNRISLASSIVLLLLALVFLTKGLNLYRKKTRETSALN